MCKPSWLKPSGWRNDARNSVLSGRERLDERAPSRSALVEDDELITCVLQEFLDEEYEVSCASMAEQALAEIAGHPVDLVLLDFHLSDGNGRRVAEQSIDVSVPVIWMTGDPEAARDVLAGSHVLLAKPFGVFRCFRRPWQRRWRLAEGRYRRQVPATAATATASLAAKYDGRTAHPWSRAEVYNLGGACGTAAIRRYNACSLGLWSGGFVRAAPPQTTPGRSLG